MLSVPLYFTVLRKCSLVVCSTSPLVCHLFVVLFVGRLSLEPCSIARLAQSVERKALNLVVVGSIPTVGVLQPVLLLLLGFGAQLRKSET